MQDLAIEQLQRLMASNSDDARKRYGEICERRDAILTRAVYSVARTLLKEGGYQHHPDQSPIQNYQQAVKVIEEYLAQSSVPETEQRLLALAGTGALAGWVVRPSPTEEIDHSFRPHHGSGDEVDPSLVHRLARALYRSPDHAPLLQPYIAEAERLSAEDAALILASIQSLLTEVPVGQLDDTLETMVIDSILGG